MASTDQTLELTNNDTDASLELGASTLLDFAMNSGIDLDTLIDDYFPWPSHSCILESTTDPASDSTAAASLLHLPESTVNKPSAHRSEPLPNNPQDSVSGVVTETVYNFGTLPTQSDSPAVPVGLTLESKPSESFIDLPKSSEEDPTPPISIQGSRKLGSTHSSSILKSIDLAMLDLTYYRLNHTTKQEAKVF